MATAIELWVNNKAKSGKSNRGFYRTAVSLNRHSGNSADFLCLHGAEGIERASANLDNKRIDAGFHSGKQSVACAQSAQQHTLVSRPARSVAKSNC
jgi:hypothetical protein